MPGFSYSQLQCFLQTDDDEFDVTIPGPWMKKWQLVHQNIHTDKMFK